MSDNITGHLEASNVALELIRGCKAFIIVTIPDSGEEPMAAASYHLLNNLEHRGFQEVVLETVTDILSGAYDGESGDDL